MWFKIKDQQIILQIIAKPNAKKTAISKISEQGLHIAIHAKPHQGAANEELIAFLSNTFAIPKKQIIIKSGENNKYKQIIMPLTNTVKACINDMTHSSK